MCCCLRSKGEEIVMMEAFSERDPHHFIPPRTGILFDDDDDGDHLPLVSLGFGINPQVSWDMVVMMVKGEEDQTIEEGLDLW